MRRRPLTLWLACVLLLTIGVSGLFVGLTLLTSGALAGDSEPAGVAIPAGIALYGAAALVGGLGVFVRKRAAHRLALLTIAIGLIELGWQTTLLGFDPITLFGLAVWCAVLVLLLSPPVRSAMRSGGRAEV